MVAASVRHKKIEIHMHTYTHILTHAHISIHHMHTHTHTLTKTRWTQVDPDTDRPYDPPIIKGVEVLWNPFEDIVPRFNKTLQKQKEQEQAA